MVWHNSWALALGTTGFFRLPVVVAGTVFLVSMCARWNTKTLSAPFIAKEHAWLLM